MIKIILASKSPRRSELLSLAGIDFQVVDSNVDEDNIREDSPENLAISLSRLKANVVAEQYHSNLILAADTIVVSDTLKAEVGIQIGSSLVLGKPRDKLEAIAMIKLLSGREHRVITAFCLRHKERQIDYAKAVQTVVTFREVEAKELDWYVNTDEPYDKAGAYGAQGHAQSFISSIKGSYSNVVGLPLSEVVVEIRKLEGVIGTK